MGMAPRRLGTSIIGPASVYQATGDSHILEKWTSKKNMRRRENLERTLVHFIIGMSSGAA